MNDIRNEQGRSDKAAERGEPSYVWRDGQKRRMQLIRDYADERIHGVILEDGCGVGSYLLRFAEDAKLAVGIEIERDRGLIALQRCPRENTVVANSCGEYLPFDDNVFDLVLSHEVLEHVNDDQLCVNEIVRCLKPGGRLILFCPNRGYPFETHGIYWKKKYYFGNKPFVNWLPRSLRDKLAPHVNIYTGADLDRLFKDLPVKVVYKSIIFGAYDNIIARHPTAGKILRSILQSMEKTPLRHFGLSHFRIIEKIAD